MPLAAIEKSTNRKIHIWDHDDPRAIFQKGDLVCPVCEGEMIVCAGMIVKPYFRHYRVCESPYSHHPESVFHLEGKRQLMGKLRAEYSRYGNISVECEVPIPEANRIADILVTFPMGWCIAHEIQLAPITVEQISERTNDYRRAGVDVIWWLGKRAATNTNILFCQEQFGEVHCIQLHEQDGTAVF